MSEGLFGIHGAALEIRAQRMGVLGSNIANAATPGYKARDIDFAAALEARLGGAGEEQSIGVAKNAVAYTATLSFLRGRVETVTRALRGE